MPEMLPPRVPISLLICDGIHTDPYTGRKTLLGLFDRFASNVFPITIPVCHVFAELTESREPTALRLRFARTAPEAEPLWESPSTDVSGGSDLLLDCVSIEWGVTNLAFPEPGEYFVQVADGYNRVVVERRLILIEQPETAFEEDDHDET